MNPPSIVSTYLGENPTFSLTTSLLGKVLISVKWDELEIQLEIFVEATHVTVVAIHKIPAIKAVFDFKNLNFL